MPVAGYTYCDETTGLPRRHLLAPRECVDPESDKT